MINGAVDSFVHTAGVLLVPLPAFGPFFRGHEPVPGARVALAYAKSVETALTGQVTRSLSRPTHALATSALARLAASRTLR